MSEFVYIRTEGDVAAEAATEESCNSGVWATIPPRIEAIGKVLPYKNPDFEDDTDLFADMIFSD